MRRRGRCVFCAITLGATAALALAQKSHDALARPRVRAEAENQRVLLLLTGGDAKVDAALAQAIGNYRSLGKLLRYEYQLAALPASSLAGKTVRKKLRLAQLEPPILAVLDTEDRPLGSIDAAAMSADGEPAS